MRCGSRAGRGRMWPTSGRTTASWTCSFCERVWANNACKHEPLCAALGEPWYLVPRAGQGGPGAASVPLGLRGGCCLRPGRPQKTQPAFKSPPSSSIAQLNQAPDYLSRVRSLNAQPAAGEENSSDNDGVAPPPPPPIPNRSSRHRHPAAANLRRPLRWCALLGQIALRIRRE